MTNLFDVSGKVAVVTGATGVLGGAMARALGKAGARVGILGRNEERANQCVQQIRQIDGQAMPLLADVTCQNDLETAKNQIESQWGNIDILVNAAGGNMPDATILPSQSIQDVDIEALRGIVDLNFLGSFITTRTFLPSMLSRPHGSIINISSMAAERPMTRVMGYAASKAAIDNYTKWLSTELATKHGEKIRVNAIAPGFFIGRQNKRLLLNEDESLTSRGEKIISHTPMQRFGKPDELAGTLLWLCSEASAFVTGTVIPVDGGFSAYSGV